MKFLNIAALLVSTQAIRLSDQSNVLLQTRAQTTIESNNQLFSELHQKIQDVQKEAAKGTADGDHAASLNADQLSPVVNRVQERWLGSLDKEEPEIVDEFLGKMKDAIADIHATEGYPMGKIAKARDADDDWLVKIVQANHKMQAMIPKITKDDNKAIADS